MKKIYLDNAATTKPAPEVIDAMKAAQEQFWGNPSSVYTIGQEARKILDEGRDFVSFFVGCKPDEIIFTSGGTESDNLAIRGIVQSHSLELRADSSELPHIITSATEHHAVLNTVKELEKEGIVEATYLKPDKNGVISPDAVKEAIRENTILVSIMYVNNETGVINPIREIGTILKAESEKRKAKSKPHIFFHCDAVQAGEFLHIAPEYLKVDLMSLSAHKLHGPRGIGILYVRKNIPIKRLITGGNQEYKKRAGTENVAGVFATHVALNMILKDRADSGTMNDFDDLPEVMSSNNSKKVMKLRDKLESGLAGKIDNIQINGKDAHRTPHISNISFINAEGEAIIIHLDFEGIAVSSGSACTSGSLDPSHVLTAMGVPAEKAHGSIRFSLSRDTTEEEIDKIIEVLPGIIEKLRAMSPIK